MAIVFSARKEIAYRRGLTLRAAERQYSFSSQSISKRLNVRTAWRLQILGAPHPDYSCHNLVGQASNSTVIDHSSLAVECLSLWQGRYSKALKRNYDRAALGPERPGKSHHGLYDP